MKAASVAMSVALAAGVLSCGNTDELQRGYSLSIEDLVVLDGPDEEESLFGDAEIDYAHCLEIDDGISEVVYDTDGVMTVKVQIFSEEGFPNGLRLQVTRLDITYTALTSADRSASVLVPIAAFSQTYSPGSFVLNAGENGETEFEVPTHVLGIDQKRKFAEDLDNLGVSDEGFPTYEIRYDLYWTDILDQSGSVSATGAFAIGNYLDEECY